MGLTGYPETSVTSYQSTLLNNPEERQNPETAQANSISASQEIPRIALNKDFHYRYHNSPSKPGTNLRDFVGVKLLVLNTLALLVA
jgi:hypothetical protein